MIKIYAGGVTRNRKKERALSAYERAARAASDWLIQDC